MAEFATRLKGLNTDLYPDRVPSGTADIVLNATVRNGIIRKRAGFAEFEDDVAGGAGILNVFVAHFANAEVHVVCKCDDGKLYERQVYPTDDESFAELATECTHNASDAGWFFMWADRMHYFDRGGGSRWHPDHLTANDKAYKAGLKRPAQGCLGTAAAGGEKDGYYHLHMSYYNDETREEGVVAGPQSPPIHCILVSDLGGIAISNWSTIITNDPDYEWTHAIFYCTQGNTEWLTPGSGVECYSYRAYKDVVAVKTQTSVGLNKADHVLNPREYFKNAGGEPPGARFGCYDGLQAVYGGIDSGAEATGTLTTTGSNNDLAFTAAYPGPAGNLIGVTIEGGGTAGSETVAVSGSEITITVESGVSTANQVITAIEASAAASALVTVALTDDDPDGNDGTGTITAGSCDLDDGSYVGGVEVQGRIDFSIPNFPTMVPRMEGYRAGGDGKDFQPWPWLGSMRTGLAGNVVGLAAGGGVVLAFTPYSNYRLHRSSDGRLWPDQVRMGYGASAQKACVGTPQAVYAYSQGRLTRFASDGVWNLSANRVTTTLELIPAGQESDTVLAYYAYEDELWCAVTPEGETVAQRLLIYSQRNDEYWTFEPARLGDAGIAAMCELALSNATPTMLLALTDGRILQYPSGTDDDGTDFAARWRGYVGQERSQYEQRLHVLNVHAGTGVEDNVTLGLRSLRTGGEGVDQYTTTLTKSSAVQRCGPELDVLSGNLFQVEFSSTDSVSDQWAINGLSVELQRVT